MQFDSSLDSVFQTGVFSLGFPANILFLNSATRPRPYTSLLLILLDLALLIMGLYPTYKLWSSSSGLCNCFYPPLATSSFVKVRDQISRSRKTTAEVTLSHVTDF
jgi:hypothetical protein